MRAILNGSSRHQALEELAEMSAPIFRLRPDPDRLLVEIAEYVDGFVIQNEDAYRTASLSLLDSLGCGLEALSYPSCTNILGPIVTGATVPNGARVPGTKFQLDPVQAAFNIGCLIRWLDFNDTWLAAEMGHPSDNLGGILATADYLSRSRVNQGKAPLVIRDVLTALVKAYEIQGVLALENSFNRVGLDHVLLVKVASSAVATKMLGGSRGEIINAVSQAWADGGTLRVYRQAPNVGSRKSWASADATSRAVWFALMALKGEMGYPSVLTASNWGFYDVLFRGKPFKQPRPFGSYVIENILFKISFPSEFHAQTAAECAVKLHPVVRDRLDQIERITLKTQGFAIRVIDKTGPLANPADRDHCLQYVVAICLLRGNLTAADYEDPAAADPRIDALRAKMVVVDEKQYSVDYLDPEKRSIANAIQIHFKDGSSSETAEIHYPIGHPRRRAEGIPLLKEKFRTNLARRFPAERQEKILALCLDQQRLESTPVNEFMDMFVS